MREQDEEQMDYEEVKEMMRTHDMYECKTCQVEFMGRKGKSLFCPICFSTSVEFLYDPEEQLNILTLLKKSDYWEVDTYDVD